MRLAEESRARLEQFFRSHEGNAALRLPAVYIHGGYWSHQLTRALRIAAITVGRHVFVSRQYLRKDAGGRWTTPGWLLAHEAAHVRQYQREGFWPFLVNYAREYLSLMWKGGKFDAGARAAAYEQIAREQEAREVEAAYLKWRARVPLSLL